MTIVSSAISKLSGSRRLLEINSLLQTKFEKLNLYASGGHVEPLPTPSAESVRFYASRVLKSEIPGPKKPPNAYNLFWKDQMPKVGGANIKERVKKLSVLWKDMSATDKHPYEEKSKKMQEVYQKEMQKLSPESLQDRARLKAERKLALNNRRLGIAKRQIRLKFEAPKRPMTSFARFQKTLDRGKMGIIDFVKHAATKWKALAPAEKQRYANEAKSAIDRYKVELAAWEKKMLDQNRDKELEVLHTGPKQKIAAAKVKKTGRKVSGRKRSAAKSAATAAGAKSKRVKAKAKTGRKLAAKGKTGRKSSAAVGKKSTAKKISKKSPKIATKV